MPIQPQVWCISETHVDSDTSYEDANLKKLGYTLTRADLPSNTKQGGACIYYGHFFAH